MNDDNVTFINKNGNIIPPTTNPVPELIEFLGELVERAKAGEIVGVAGGILTKDKHGEFFSSGIVGGFSMIGALECINHHLKRVARGEQDNPLEEDR